MKKLLLLVLLLSMLAKSYSQCVSIELAIEHKAPETMFCLQGVKECSYLTITYWNNTDRPLYFLKVSKGSTDIPPLVAGGTLKMLSTIDNLKDFQVFYNDNEYRVYIYRTPYYSSSWEIITEGDDNDAVHELSRINDVLSDFYEYLPGAIESDTITDYDAKDITEKGILNKFRNNFVFLNAGEKHTDEYNLIGFQMLGGNYQFTLDKDSLDNFVYTNPMWDLNLRKWVYKKMTLPSKIGNYSLYNGKVCTNVVSVKFTRPQKKSPTSRGTGK